MVEQQQEWLSLQLVEQNKKMEEQHEVIRLMATRMKELQSGNHSFSSRGELEGGRSTFHFNPRIEFPVFEGINPREWIKKCKKYFVLCQVPDS